MNYGLKADFQKIQKQGVSLNETIVIFRAGKITLAEKVSSLCPKAWPNLAAGSYASSSLRYRGVSSFRSIELVYVGLSLPVWSCLFALSLHVQVWTPRLNRAGYRSWWYSSWPLAVLLGLPSIWSDGAGRQREAAWGLEGAELAGIS